jgi:pre-mRNA-splicing helicase BRR2
MFEICLKRGWAVPAKAALDLCKMVEKRMSVVSYESYQAITNYGFNRWGSMTPLRQFKGVPTDVIRKAEGKQFVSRSIRVLLFLKMIDSCYSPGTVTLI